MALVIEQPKWVLSTKRGWGMVITGLTVAVPLIAQFTGLPLDQAVVNTVGQTVATGIDVVGTLVGVGLWIYGSFRPTAPLKLLP